MKQETIKVRVSGVVQGVCFREYTRRKAVELSLGGWVRNCSDGTVEAMIGGPPERVQDMITWLHHGSPASRVEEVVVEPVEAERAVPPFRIVF